MITLQTQYLSAVLALVIPLTTLACSKDDDKASSEVNASAPKAAEPKPAVPQEGIAVHCDEVAQLGYCSETPYASPTWQALGEDDLRQRCRSGVYGKSECPQEGRVGSCTASNSEIIHFYSTGGSPRTSAEAQAYCVDMFSGTFTE